MRYEIRIAGEGGQGVVLAAVILAEALGVYGDWYVAQTQSYGAEVRGGYSKAEVVISDSRIDYPKAIRPDIFVALNQVSCNAYYRDLRAESGIFIVDSSVVKSVPTTKAIKVPFSEMARGEFKPFVTNMIMLGAVTFKCEYIEYEHMKAAIMARVPKGSEDINMRAFIKGFEQLNYKGGGG